MSDFFEKTLAKALRKSQAKRDKKVAKQQVHDTSKGNRDADASRVTQTSPTVDSVDVGGDIDIGGCDVSIGDAGAIDIGDVIAEEAAGDIDIGGDGLGDDSHSNQEGPDIDVDETCNDEGIDIDIGGGSFHDNIHDEIDIDGGIGDPNVAGEIDIDGGIGEDDGDDIDIDGGVTHQEDLEIDIDGTAAEQESLTGHVQDNCVHTDNADAGVDPPLSPSTYSSSQAPLEISVKEITRTPASNATSTPTKATVSLMAAQQPFNKESCLAVVDSLLNIEEFRLFAVPFDWKAANCLNYPIIIKTPMDFSTVKNRLDAGQYRTNEEFTSDLNLIWRNGLRYNNKASPAGELATKLQRRTRSLLEEHAVLRSTPSKKAKYGIASRKFLQVYSALKRSPHFNLFHQTYLSEHSDLSKVPPNSSHPMGSTEFPQKATIDLAIKQEKKNLFFRGFLDKMVKKAENDSYASIREFTDEMHAGLSSVISCFGSESSPGMQARFFLAEFDLIVLEKMIEKGKKAKKLLKKPATPLAGGSEAPKMKSSDRTRCRDILGQLKSVHLPFATPVQPWQYETLNDYYTIVTMPMDLETVSRKLECNAYSTPSEFYTDVNQISKNVFKYYEPHLSKTTLTDADQTLCRTMIANGQALKRDLAELWSQRDKKPKLAKPSPPMPPSPGVTSTPPVAPCQEAPAPQQSPPDPKITFKNTGVTPGKNVVSSVKHSVSQPLASALSSESQKEKKKKKKEKSHRDPLDKKRRKIQILSRCVRERIIDQTLRHRGTDANRLANHLNGTGMTPAQQILVLAQSKWRTPANAKCHDVLATTAADATLVVNEKKVLLNIIHNHRRARAYMIKCTKTAFYAHCSDCQLSQSSTRIEDKGSSGAKREPMLAIKW